LTKDTHQQDPVNLLKDIFMPISNIHVRRTYNGSENMCNAQTVNIGWLAFLQNIQICQKNSSENLSSENLSSENL
jgi:hypothetical protein